MSSSQPVRVLMVGARTVRQGTGPFIADGLARAGASICGLVGTRETSVDAAVEDLKRRQGIDAAGYTDLATALQQLRPDAVALCSPWRFHREQLQLVARSGSHCLVEKPLAWPATLAEMDKLLAEFESRSLLLQMVAQWPTTLGAFARLHPAPNPKPAHFRMRLSPVSIGADMVTDSAPHFISMLQALAGPGDCLDCKLEQHAGDKLSLSCRYKSATASLSAQLLLETCEQRPRPAWYEIDGLRADRQVSMPEYQQSLVNGAGKVTFSDPMHEVTAQFLQDLQAGTPTDGDTLRSAHRNLQQLAAAWR